MKKSDIVNVTNNARYSGQYMSWTEPQTDKGILKAGTILYHTSENKLVEFLSKNTCFYTDNRGSNHIYSVTLLEDVSVDYYGKEEVRFLITSTNVLIKYLGWRGKSKKTNYQYKDYTIMGG